MILGAIVGFGAGVLTAIYAPKAWAFITNYTRSKIEKD